MPRFIKRGATKTRFRLAPDQFARLEEIAATLNTERAHSFRLRASRILQTAASPHAGFHVSDSLVERAIATALQEIEART